jgi:glyoxylase-like metal-dependent hydrolase (beta-lactamase superfamily II)
MWTKTEIAKDVFFVSRDWLSANHLIALSPRLTMIDTGYGGDLAETLDVLQSLARAPEEVELIVNTHCHCDHCGGNFVIHQRSGCEIWMHEKEKERMDRCDDTGTWWRFHDTWAQSFPVHRGLQAGEELRAGPLTLQVIHAPGHSRGLIMLYCRQLKALFSSDALWHGDMGVVNPIVEGEDALQRAIETLELISGMDIDTVYPGHGPVIANPKAVLRRVQTKLRRYQDSPELMHMDHLRKMFAYVVLSKGSVPVAGFFGYLMQSVWFREVVDRFFDGRYEDMYQSTMESVLRNRMLQICEGELFGTGKS